MATPVVFAELLQQFSADKLSLADLLAKMAQRGPVQGPLHRADLAKLDEALKAGTVDAKVHRIVSHKLKEYQTAQKPADTGGPAGAAVVEKTMMVPPPGGGEEKTVMNPPPGGGEEKTVMNPPPGGGGDGIGLEIPSPGGADAETTAFTPTVVQGPNTQTGTGSGTGGPSTSSWNRLASAGDSEQNVYPGMMLKERFYLEKEVGRGGMGVVYKARDERKVEAQDKDPWVAVKILNDEFRSHPQSLIALQREARKAQQLTHDNVLRVYDFDKAGVIVYVTMEYVEGGTVKEYIKKVKKKGGQSYEEAQPVIEGMARGLGRAHRDRIVHSDFKPGNVMLGADLVPKVFDLGIARAAKTDEEKQSGETTVFDAATLGALTPAYASLEMIRGEEPTFADDIYALAISAYECLTGTHPFNKRNAEEALKKGMKPARIPGLTGKQWKTLQKGLAFHRKDRLQTADELIEGMRPRTFRDYAVPVTISVASAILLVAAVFGVLLPKLQDARVEAMVENFRQSQFADHQTALNELNAMDPVDRQETLQKGSEDIQNYFFRLANQKWDTSKKKYEYEAAGAIFKAAQGLYPDSRSVSENRARIEEEQKQAIVAFEEALTTAIEEGKVYEGQEGNAVEILGYVRRMDPTSVLLDNEGLKARYRTDIRTALGAENLDLSEQRVVSALKAFPTDSSLSTLAADVKAARDSQLAALKKQEQLAAFAKMTPEEVRAALSKLATAPDFSPDWQAQVDAAIGALATDASPEAAQLRDTLSAVFAQRIGTETEGKKYASAQLVAELGLRLFPKAPALLEQKSKLDTARRALEAEQAALALKGQMEDMKGKVLILADASELTKMERVLVDLQKRGMGSNDPFMSGETGNRISAAYVKQVERIAAQGRYDQAQSLASRGLKWVPGSDQLKKFEREYTVEGTAQRLQAAAASPATADSNKVNGWFAELKQADAARYAKVLNDLPGTTVKAIQALIPRDRGAAVKAKAEWLKVFPQNSQLASLVIPEPTQPTPSTAAAPTPKPAPSASKPSSSTSASAGGSSARRGAPTPGKVCAANMSKYGARFKAQCWDKVNGEDGPRLVVVPNPAGGTLAVTKFEIKADEYNAYCKNTGKCRPQSGNGNLPATNVSFGQAKAYADWLTETTGFTYRLPTESEWAHIAEAGGNTGSDFNCVVMQGSNQVKGGNAIDAKIGKANAWGLVNVIGNAAEWVQAGGGSAARGGNFNVPNAQCTVDWRDSGSGASSTVGMRLIREMG